MSFDLRGLGVPIAVLLAGCSFDRAVLVDAGPVADAPGPPRRKLITIDPDKVTGDQAAFPVWIALADADLASSAAADGSDIYFARPDGAPLEHELQRWTKATGQLEAWVRVDLADSAPTLLELRYGDPRPAYAPNPPLVFGSSFAAVWHLDDSLATPEVADATTARDGVAMGGLAAGAQVAARLGGGIAFDGVDNQIQFTNPFAGNGPHTISAWVSQNATTSSDSIVTTGNPVANQSRWFHSHFEAGGGAAAGFFNNDWLSPPNMDLDGAGWVLVHWVLEGTVSNMYRDGVKVGGHTHQTGINTQGTAGYLGFAPNAWGPCALSGILDEVRLATVARSAGWIATEFANQSSPGTFYSVGAEEIVAP